jgi:hypothetical protein
MPYCVSGKDDDGSRLTQLVAIGEELKKIKRSGVKSLWDAAFRSEDQFKLELLRLKSIFPGELRIAPEDYAMVCDATEFYDLWFGEE